MPHWSVLLRREIPVKLRRGYLGPERFEEIVQALEAGAGRDKHDPYFHLAYDCLAPLAIIFSLVQWRRFRDQGIDTIFYIARDARVMLDVYDIIAGQLNGDFSRSYIRLSRKAVTLAHPDDLLQNAEPIAGKMGRRTVGEWLKNFTVDSGLQRRILLEARLNINNKFDEEARYALRAACRGTLLSAIKDHQRRERSLIRDYLFQQSGGRSLKRVGIVDSGWACTTQDVIRGVLEDADIVSGVYFGVSSQGRQPDPGNLKYGLLRDDFRNSWHRNPLEGSAGVIRVWDTLLREPVGTVSRLRRGSDGMVAPDMEDSGVIGDIEASAARSISHGVRQGTEARLKGVSLLAESIGRFSDRDFEIAGTAFAQKISSHPSRDMARAVMRLGFDEGTASGSKGLLGVGGIRTGVAWYPGILASFGLAWTYPVLKTAARTMLLIRKKTEA